MKLHILTACSRPENLSQVGESISHAQERASMVGAEWHLLFDPEKISVGGQELKNWLLDDITDGWVCILDDDTIMHPNFMRKIDMVVATGPLAENFDLNAIVVSQKRVNGMVLQAAPENVRIGMIDAGQVVLRRSLIGESRIPLEYAGDGMWLEELLYGTDGVHYMRDVLSLHNAISGVDVGPRWKHEAAHGDGHVQPAGMHQAVDPVLPGNRDGSLVADDRGQRIDGRNGGLVPPHSSF